MRIQIDNEEFPHRSPSYQLEGDVSNGFLSGRWLVASDQRNLTAAGR
jgi:hypothetical protein